MNEKQSSEDDKYEKLFQAVLSTPESEFYAKAEEKILSRYSKAENMKRQQTFDSENMKTNLQPKKRKETVKDRLLEWNNYYSESKFGIWIQCTKCSKWRKEMEYEESHEVPSNWCCSMSTSGIKSCHDPENKEEGFSPVDFAPGSIVWAKLDGYPWWPGMVEVNPDTEGYYWTDDKHWYFNITFLDDKVTYAWVPDSNVCSFLNPPRQLKNLEKNMKANYIPLMEAAKKKAKEALAMPIKERLQKFSFVQRYRGKWPLAKNDDDDDNDKITEDITEILIKEVEDIESISSDSGNTTRSSEEQINQNKMDENDVIMINYNETSAYAEKMNSKCNNTKTEGNNLDSKIYSNINFVHDAGKKEVSSFSSKTISKIQPSKNVDARMKFESQLNYDENDIKVKMKKTAGTTSLKKNNVPQTNYERSFKTEIGENEPERNKSGTNQMENAFMVKKNLANAKKKAQKKVNGVGIQNTQASKLSQQKVKPLFKPPVKDSNGNNQCKENWIENKSNGTSHNTNRYMSHCTIQNERKKIASELTTASIGSSNIYYANADQFNIMKIKNIPMTKNRIEKGNPLNKNQNTKPTKTNEENQESVKETKGININENTDKTNEKAISKFNETQKSKPRMQDNEVNSSNEILKILEKNVNSSINNNHDINSEATRIDFKAASNKGISEPLNMGNNYQGVVESVFENGKKNDKFECGNANNDKKGRANVKKRQYIVKRKLDSSTSSFNNTNENLKSTIKNHSTVIHCETNANGYEQAEENVDLTDLHEDELKLPNNPDSEGNSFALSLNLNVDQSESEESDPFETE